MFFLTDALEHYENVTDYGHRCIKTAGIWATYPQEHVSNVTGFFDQVCHAAFVLVNIKRVASGLNISFSDIYLSYN